MAITDKYLRDGGVDVSVSEPTLTQAQIQAAVRKLASGQPLTIAEQAAVGATPTSTVTPSVTPSATPIVSPEVKPADKPVAGKKVPAGFTEGPFPKELEQFFGSSDGVLGYRIETVTDKNGRTYNQLSIATGPGSSSTFGAGFVQGADGKYTTYSPPGGTTNTTNTNTNNTTNTTSTGLKTDAQIAAETAAAKAQGERQSAYDLLYSEFSKYGLQSLVAPLKGLITTGASPAEFTIKLRESPEYQARFAGNAQRIAKGLTAIDEATYLAKEDAYQNLMRNYGLPESYWKTGALGTQEGFTKLIANDVSAVELENRLQTAQQRVVNANPEVAYTLKAFYPDITNGDILAYALDPKNALDTINRKVTAAEIGGAALAQGLSTSLGGAEGLAAYGITKAQAQQGYQNVAGMVPRGSQLADIYGQQPYNQGTAEAEVFGTAGAADAKKRREKLISLESASFGGSSGVGALGRDKAIYGSTFGQSGQY